MLKPNPNLLADNAAAGYGAPIIFLPMKDAATAHINEGTGGNFVQNGTLDTASRGANQDNCKASYFDGVADYLSRTSLAGVADGKQFTFSCTSKATDASIPYLISLNNEKIYIIHSGIKVEIKCKNQAGAIIFNAYTNFPSSLMSPYKTFTITVSVDLTDSLKTRFFIDGKQMLITVGAFANDNIAFSNGIANIGRNIGGAYRQGNIGELYFDTRYIDLSVNNPFWEED